MSALADSRVAPISAAQSLWLPWGVGGWWSALGLAAYVLIVSVVGGSMVARRVEYRGIARPAPAWIWLAFGASGYGAELLGRSGGARLVLAVVLAPLTVRLFAYRVDGSRRGWPSRLSLGRRLLSAGLLGAAVLALSYSTTHAFAQDGSAGASSPTLWPGQAMVLDVGLQGIALPSQITAVDLDGRGVGAVSVIRAALTGEGGGRLISDGSSAVTGPVARALPVRVAPRTGTWLAVGLRLHGCPARSPRIDAITIHYRVLGIATSERIALWSSVQVACRGVGAGALSGSSLSE
jgi:hypothetical protein